MLIVDKHRGVDKSQDISFFSCIHK